ncbi:MAG: hypothetical protein ACRDUV_13530 [Pseudonocardiaceae bacterium]
MSNEYAGPLDWCDRAPLSSTDLTDFLALWRVCGRRDSRVDQVGDRYVEQGRPVLPFLADALAALIDVGHVTLGEPGPAPCARRPLVVTASGRARYEYLCDTQGVTPYPAVVIDLTPDGWHPTPECPGARNATGVSRSR